MIFRPYYLSCLSHASYLVADEASGRAAVVDPQRDVGQYLADASKLGVRVTDVILTHFHADFVSGHLELVEATGARIHVGAQAHPEYGFVPAHDGDALELGPTTRLVFRETPGHTPESISVLVFDRAKSETAPTGVLTGDALFIGDVGRPDLMASVGVTAEELGGLLYDSLHQKLLTLPDTTVVYPAHGAGSLCGKNLSSELSSPLGVQRRTNYALQPMSKAEFVRVVTADQPESPAYFAFAADANRRTHETLDHALARTAATLSLDDVLRLAREGAILLDVRPSPAFGSAHLAGSINLALRGSFATWAGTLLDRSRPVVLLGDPGSETEAATRLGRIGFDQVAGHLDDLMGAMKSRPDLVRRVTKVSPVELWARIDAGTAPLVVDVRAPSEHAHGHVPGSVSIPLPHLLERKGVIPRDREVVVHCQGGYRSSIAASLLAREGWTNVSDLVGGFVSFEAARAPAFPEV